MSSFALRCWTEISRTQLAANFRAIRKTVESPEFVDGCEKLGVHPAFMSATEFGDLVAKEDDELAGLMGLVGLKRQ